MGPPPHAKEDVISFITQKEEFRLDVAVTFEERKRRIFEVNGKIFKSMPLPGNLQEFWGPIPMESLPEGINGTESLTTATHKLTEPDGTDTGVAVRVAHSIPLGMSGIQVFV